MCFIQSVSVSKLWWSNVQWTFRFWTSASSDTCCFSYMSVFVEHCFLHITLCHTNLLVCTSRCFHWLMLFPKFFYNYRLLISNPFCNTTRLCVWIAWIKYICLYKQGSYLWSLIFELNKLIFFFVQAFRV